MGEASERRVWWHWQNLNDRRDGSRGSVLRHGRAWLHAWRSCLGVEWSLFNGNRLGLVFATGGENDFGLTVHLWWASLYLTVSGLLPYHWLDRTWPRETGFRLSRDQWYLRFYLACKDDVHPPEKGWRWSAFLVDKLFGSARYTKETLREVDTAVPMPERSYPCTVHVYRAEWKRPRWPFTKRLLRAEVDIPDGVPVPGKGTAAHNCGPDAIYGQTSLAKDEHDAIAQVVESAMRQRANYPA